MNVRKDKGLPDLHIEDQVEITVNDQNLLVDVHKNIARTASFPSRKNHAEFDLAGPDEEHGISLEKRRSGASGPADWFCRY